MRNIHIQELATHIVHRCPRGAENVAAQLSEDLAALSPGTSQFLETKLELALSEASDIVEMTDVGSPVPQLIEDFHAGRLNLLDASMAIAERLQATQTGATPSGILLVCSALVSSVPYLIIAKMEHESGARAEPVENSAGKQVFEIELIQDLFLTSKTRVFKFAAFSRECAERSNFRGELTDTQAPGRGLAEYFLHDFLGCQRARRAEVLTQDFFHAVMRSATPLEISDRARLQVALNAEMRSNDRQIRPQEFVQRHVPVDMQVDVMTRLEDVHVPRVFHKDLGLIESELNSIQIVYENGTVVFTLPESLGSSVKISNSQTTVDSVPTRMEPARKKLSMTDRLGPGGV